MMAKLSAQQVVPELLTKDTQAELAVRETRRT
jgi:hypothetical protein